ncbi:TniQ family protein [Streptomyces stelliscabiei]|uniref:TniQ family protein n=1 Tax=Streptomyces stelliscabiei TaxID=146820 RepID=UPI0029BB3B97|nr:TniQ family protein [Streptomyces stelliscabiei]MDX2515854.1 TniQ family protein [Streptomyces stelliscabiei]MDX2549433.1 TniQ family protein [Streptomyces stelliscabiei]MDX2611455.1 TniQ family protein [Streptomyces stelliscabiei]MDX2634449.1 TniQ family protein [Streptomyces stelliscabiei]MDX2659395.1 TniQ family protein [Streptomyces stelliscabiei]
MTVWTPHRLPIVVPPLPGEALDSWLEAYARRLLVTSHAFLRFLGLPGARPAQMTQRLTDQQRDRLHQATGVGKQDLTALTLEPFDGITVSFHPNKRGMGRPSTWRYFGSHSRFCPGCLTDATGRWQLAWRQPWSFACPVHLCLLLERCPSCGQPVRAHGTRDDGPSQPALCTRGRHRAEGPRRLRIVCAYRLGEAAAPALPDGGLVLAAQQRVTPLLDDVFLRPELTQTRLLDLYALGWRALAGLAADLDSAPPSVHRVLEETGGQLPSQVSTLDATDVRSIAIGTAIARLAIPNLEPMEPAALEWIMQADRRLFPEISPSARAFNWKRTSPRLAGHALSRYDSELTLIPRLRYGTATPQPYWRELTDAQLQRRATAVPAKLWPSWTMRLLTPRLANCRSADRFRKAASTMLLMPGSRIDYSPATALLGHRVSHRARIAAFRMLDGYPYTPLASALAQLAWALDRHGAPIDYTRRRRIFRPDTILLDELALRHVGNHLDGPQASPATLSHLRWCLLALLHGADPEPETATLAEHHNFRQHMPPQLEEFLHHQAEANLAKFEINEPVRWEPPPEWAVVPHWPGHDDTGIDRDHAAVLAALSPVERQLAKELGFTTTHLRLYFESRRLTIPPLDPGQRRARRTPSRTRGKGVPRVGPLDPARLQDLYLEQRMTQQQIAVLAGCSHSTVGNAIREAGLSIQHRRPRGTLERTVSRTWLEQEYQHKGRSTLDIARELGLHKTDVMRLIKKWNITKSPNGHGQYRQPFAHLNVTSSPAMHAVSRTRNCVQRLRHLVETAQHRNIQSAAVALGVQWSSLSYQLKRIEETAGFAIIERSRPLTVTEAGREFLLEAQRLLALLDDNSP